MPRKPARAGHGGSPRRQPANSNDKAGAAASPICASSSLRSIAPTIRIAIAGYSGSTPPLQLGQHRLEHDPGRDEPGHQKLRAGLAPGPPGHGRGHAPRAARQARPSPRTATDTVRAARHAIPGPPTLLSMSLPTDLVRTHARAPADHDNQAAPASAYIRPQTRVSFREPRRHRDPGSRARRWSRPAEHQDQRALDQDADRERGPEDRGPAPGRMRPHPLRAATTDRRATSRPSRRSRRTAASHRSSRGVLRRRAAPSAHQERGEHRVAPRDERRARAQ